MRVLLPQFTMKTRACVEKGPLTIISRLRSQHLGAGSAMGEGSSDATSMAPTNWIRRQLHRNAASGFFPYFPVTRSEILILFHRSKSEPVNSSVEFELE